MSPADVEFTPVATPADIAAVASLAAEIWYEHYVPIIGREQVDYMVPRFQSEPAIRAQISGGLEYSLVRHHGKACGYFAIEPQAAERRMFLSKLYLLKSARGAGLARRALASIEAQCEARGFDTLWLTVNKYNPALHAYERLGFRRVADVVTDIGGGYVMDDYRLEKGVRGKA
jgi:ribosomal protein S18 acetylase RimI-like enzyme